MRVAIYGRVSTAEQSAAMQLEELRAYCQRRQWEIAEEFIDTMSGSKESRPALSRLLADAKRRKWDAVWFIDYDRFARAAFVERPSFALSLHSLQDSRAVSLESVRAVIEFAPLCQQT